jgi:hypothetical protein
VHFGTLRLLVPIVAGPRAALGRGAKGAAIEAGGAGGARATFVTRTRSISARSTTGRCCRAANRWRSR